MLGVPPGDVGLTSRVGRMAMQIIATVASLRGICCLNERGLDLFELRRLFWA